MGHLIWESTNDTAWATGSNWSTGSAPTDGDDVYFERSNVGVAGTDQSAVALATLHFRSSFSGYAGSFDTPVQIGTARLIIGEAQNDGRGARSADARSQGSRRINLDLGSTTACQAIIYGTAPTSLDLGLSPVRLLANNSSTNIKIDSGSVGIAPLPNESSTVGNITLGRRGTRIDEAFCFVGRGVTWSTAIVNGGRLVLHSGGSTPDLLIHAGEVISEGTHALDTVTMYGGRFVLKSTGAVDEIIMYGGILDLSQTADSRTITNIYLRSPNCQVINGPNVVYTNNISVSVPGILSFSAIN